MSKTTVGSGKPSVLASSIAIQCPAQGAPVPAAFSVSGIFSLAFAGDATVTDGVVVKCKVAYFDHTGAATSQCRVCVLQAQNWCCRFDLSANPPSAGAPLVLDARLYDSSGGLIAGPDATNVVYQANAPDPCSCSGAGTPC